VPAGLTITTDVCNYYYNNDQKFPINLEEEVKEALQKVELDMGKSLATLATRCFYLFVLVPEYQCRV
jgi:phosphoenolpyruvate synthase/pyruvate phosphate dikinase